MSVGQQMTLFSGDSSERAGKAYMIGMIANRGWTYADGRVFSYPSSWHGHIHAATCEKRRFSSRTRHSAVGYLARSGPIWFRRSVFYVRTTICQQWVINTSFPMLNLGWDADATLCRGEELYIHGVTPLFQFVLLWINWCDIQSNTSPKGLFHLQVEYLWNKTIAWNRIANERNHVTLKYIFSEIAIKIRR